MAWSAATHPTMIDVVRQQSPSGGMIEVAELLSQQNEMLQDMVMFPSNEALAHVEAIRTGLPSGTWRRFNMGVQPSKSTTNNVRFEMGNYEAYAEIDRDLANINGNSAEWRRREEFPFIEHMNQQMQKMVIYGNTADEPGAFPGLVHYYSDNTASSNPSADNLIDAGGSGTDNRSIWFICWGPSTVFGIYPRGYAAGLQMQDKGEVTIEDADGSGGRLEAYRTHYKWQNGLVVKDWRYAVRIANIDKSDLSTTAGSGSRLHDLMFQAIDLIPNPGMGRCAFYMSRDLRTMLRQQTAHAVRNSTLTIEQIGGVPVMMYQGFPIRRVDVMATDEAQVS